MNITSNVKNKFNNPFISMKHKNFRYYWIGMCVSLIGTWMQNIAQPWLAYSLTKSPLLLSLITALQFTPVLLFSLFAGVIIDKFPKKKVIIVTQSASLIITFILAMLVYTGRIQYWHIVVMSVLIGIVNAFDMPTRQSFVIELVGKEDLMTFDMPTRQSFVIELVGKEDLMNGIALNSMAFNTARIIGPSIAALIMAYFGIAACFFINAISFGAVLISLFFIKPIVQIRDKLKNNNRIFSEIKAGLKYISQHAILLDTLLVLAIVGTFAPNFGVLVPVYAKEILKQNEAGFGILMSFMGIGSFIGAISMATLSKAGPKRYIVYFVPLIVGIALISTGYTNVFISTGILLAITGFFFIIFSSNVNSTLQINSSNEYRGRVMSMYTLVFAGSTPFGNLFAGFFTERFNARIGFIACGAIIVVLMVPIYIYKSRRKVIL